MAGELVFMRRARQRGKPCPRQMPIITLRSVPVATTAEIARTVGSDFEQLAVDYTGTAMAISFNAQYVLDFLNVVETDIVSLSLKDEVSQAVMKPVGAEGYDYTYVIMPMRI